MNRFFRENQFTISLRTRPLLMQYVTTMNIIFSNETILKCPIIAIHTPPIHPICLYFGKIYLNYTSLRLLHLQLLLNTLCKLLTYIVKQCVWVAFNLLTVNIHIYSSGISTSRTFQYAKTHWWIKIIRREPCDHICRFVTYSLYVYYVLNENEVYCNEDWRK